MTINYTIIYDEQGKLYYIQGQDALSGLLSIDETAAGAVAKFEERAIPYFNSMKRMGIAPKGATLELHCTNPDMMSQ